MKTMAISATRIYMTSPFYYFFSKTHNICDINHDPDKQNLIYDI